MAPDDPDSGTRDMLKTLLQAGKGISPDKVDVLDLKPLLKEGNRKSNLAQLDVLRKEGNRFFKEGNYVAAMNLYSQCIVQSGEAMEMLPTWWNAEEERGPKATKIRKNLFMALSNRAETWLRLKDYRRALKDADRALESEPKHAKCLVRRGKSLEGLQRFEEAYSCFTAALEQFPNDLVIQNSLRRSKICYEQCHEGLFDLSRCDVEDLDPCCEFVGPVAIQQRREDGDGGRGLFLTKDTTAGELLLVSHALAIFGGDPKEKHPIATTEDYWIAKTGRSFAPADEDLALNLAFGAAKNLELKEKLCCLFSGSQQADVPAMELFKPGAKWCPIRRPRGGGLEYKISAHKDMVGRMRKVVKYNAFTDFDDWGRAYSGCRGREEYLKSGCGGLWLLPSFLNHSCSPNCTKVYIGKSMFVRASRAMAAGEELSLAYCDVSVGVESRRSRLRKWGFECRCRRCLTETSR